MSPVRLLVSLASLAPLTAMAATWPGPAPCNTTLQACIDATADGGSVVIDSDASIDESLNLYNRSLSLSARVGRKPTLAPGNWISVSSAAILGNQNVSIRGLILRDSYVSAAYSGVGTATYDFSELVFEQTALPVYLRVEARAGTTVQAQLYNNRITGQPRNLNAGLIEVVNAGGTFNATAYYNEVRNTASASDASSPTSSTATTSSSTGSRSRSPSSTGCAGW